MILVFDSASVKPRPFALGLATPDRPAPARETKPAAPNRPYEPTPEDRRWWAAESDRVERERDRRRADRYFDQRFRETYRTDAACRGLIPHELAGALSSTGLVGHPE